MRRYHKHYTCYPKHILKKQQQPDAGILQRTQHPSIQLGIKKNLKIQFTPAKQRKRKIECKPQPASREEEGRGEHMQQPYHEKQTILPLKDPNKKQSYIGPFLSFCRLSNFLCTHYDVSDGSCGDALGLSADESIFSCAADLPLFLNSLL